MFLNTTITGAIATAIWPPRCLQVKAHCFARREYGSATTDACLTHSPDTNDMPHLVLNHSLEIVAGFHCANIVDVESHRAGNGGSTR